MTEIRERLSRRQRQAELASPKRAGTHGRRLIRQRRREVFRQHWRIFAVVSAIGAGCAIAAQVLLPDWVAGYVVGGVAVTTVWMIVYALHSLDGMANHRLGIVGEELTSDELRKLRKQGWQFVNHVMLEKSDVDHAVLGPGGFFAIDSKYRTDWSTSRSGLDAIADTVRWHADQLHSRLGQPSLRVRAVVVLWGPRVSDVFDDVFEHHGVTFCLGKELGAYLRALESTVDPEVVDEALAALDAYVAKRDIGEAREHGDPARSILGHIEDISTALAIAGVAFVALSLITRVPPAGVWTVGLAVAFTGASLMIRRSGLVNERLQLATTATLAVSLGFGGFVLAVLVFNLIW